MKDTASTKAASAAVPAATIPPVRTSEAPPQHGGGHIVHTPEPPTVLPKDAHHGKGGDYVMDAGVRRRVDSPPLAEPQPAAGEA